ncbi:hypothetical protein TorRG33x02_023330 [Trema orientale]|uniref:Uncharacterized protein n=1 Tax=Trema orientale TaxID=63057 RepID=A0A2P5FW59_TREOI|nr:hypothetical protein TorRG33x02_023330 [Trema orientale]
MPLWMIYRIITKEKEQIKDLIEELRLAIRVPNSSAKAALGVIVSESLTAPPMAAYPLFNRAKMNRSECT